MLQTDAVKPNSLLTRHIDFRGRIGISLSQEPRPTPTCLWTKQSRKQALLVSVLVSVTKSSAIADKPPDACAGELIVGLSYFYLTLSHLTP